MQRPGAFQSRGDQQLIRLAGWAAQRLWTPDPIITAEILWVRDEIIRLGEQPSWLNLGKIKDEAFRTAVKNESWVFQCSTSSSPTLVSQCFSGSVYIFLFWARKSSLSVFVLEKLFQAPKKNLGIIFAVGIIFSNTCSWFKESPFFHFRFPTFQHHCTSARLKVPFPNFRTFDPSAPFPSGSNGLITDKTSSFWLFSLHFNWHNELGIAFGDGMSSEKMMTGENGLHRFIGRGLSKDQFCIQKLAEEAYLSMDKFEKENKLPYQNTTRRESRIHFMCRVLRMHFEPGARSQEQGARCQEQATKLKTR